ncbi:hypothetical protein NUW54_g2238 [Trametes sanguinea]|uniref:Uncharacterized protein n=1 Tax=Trametes sanguinea TaxID=158606 RepID=A0ACC1Q4C7_9APHY|nr:hypothetical protein NUW54_g2238 [Trametes sanguinea]
MLPNPEEPKDDQEPRCKDLETAHQALDAAAISRERSRTVSKGHPRVTNSLEVISKTSSSQGLGILLDGVNGLAASLPSLIRALEAVAQVHPVLAVAVGAFKVVVEIKVKVHDNDKKVDLLFLEMHNMMAALLQLRNVRRDHIGRDGLTIGKRLEDVVQKAAQDIKDCANTCNAYSRQRVLAKVFKAPSWELILKDYIQRFNNRKVEFTFVISLHTGIGVDRANEKLDTLMTKMDVVLEFFEKIVPREQHILREFVRARGGPHAALSNIDALQAILAEEQQLMPATMRSSQKGSDKLPLWRNTLRNPAATLKPDSNSLPSESRRPNQGRASKETSHVKQTPGSTFDHMPLHGTGTPSAPAVSALPRSNNAQEPLNAIDKTPGRTLQPSGPRRPQCRVPHSTPRPVGQLLEENGELDQLKRDLAEDPAIMVIQRNFASFDKIFTMQQREMMRELQRVARVESDRVISTVLAGPHERIVDRDLHEIWKDMRWGRAVDARFFVPAVHDYYIQILIDEQRVITSNVGAQHLSSEDDAWALEFLEPTYHARIAEAFEYDASGHVSIQEVNRSTSDRFEGWSLLRWIVYWAAGWRVAMTEYKRKIHTILSRMRRIAPTVRPQVHMYSHSSVSQRYLAPVEALVKPITMSFSDDNEHHYLLTKFKDYVDQQETMIREQLEIARYHIDSREALELINGPLGLERNVLIILYLLLRRHYQIMRMGQKVLIHPEELPIAVDSIFFVHDALSCRAQHLAGMFAVLGVYDREGIPGSRSPSFNVPPEFMNAEDEVDFEEGIDELSETVLRFPPFREDFYPESNDCVQEEVGYERDIDVGASGAPDGYEFQESYIFTFGYHFHASPRDSNQLFAGPTDPMSLQQTRLTVWLEVASSGAGDRPVYRMTESWNTSAPRDLEYALALDDDGVTLSGRLLDLFWPASRQVVMKKGPPPEVMVFYPSPAEFSRDKVKALWRFALDAILYDVRRRLFSWAFIKKRKDHRRRFVSLNFATSTQIPLAPDQSAELDHLYRRLLPADIEFYAHAALEPPRYPANWFLPRCKLCSRIMEVDTQRLCCCSCSSFDQRTGDEWMDLPESFCDGAGSQAGR